jgi:hypothetical protein
MLGEQIGITTGKRLVRRVLSTEPPTAEVSFEDSGTILGVAVTGVGTYTSVIGADGSLHGDGQGRQYFRKATTSSIVRGVTTTCGMSRYGLASEA